LNDPKEYINDMAYNVKKVFSLVKKVLPLKDDLDKIIEREYKKAFKILKKFGIIEYIENKYKINYIKPELEILEYEPSIIGEYSEFENEIIFSKKSIERLVDKQLKSLGYKEIIRSISNIQGIEYLNRSYNLKFLYPFYINEKDIKKAIEEAIIRSVMFHEFWHSIDYSILDKLVDGSIIKDIDYFTILKNLELRASAFEVVMYYLVNGFHKHERGYIAAYFNIPICRKYIKEINELQNDKNKNKYVPYDLGFCYGNVIVAKYKSSLEENIYKIIDDIIHLDKERAIDEIKLYGDNLEWISNDKNSNIVI
jgi:uncharacterized protein YqgQ